MRSALRKKPSSELLSRIASVEDTILWAKFAMESIDGGFPSVKYADVRGNR